MRSTPASSTPTFRGRERRPRTGGQVRVDGLPSVRTDRRCVSSRSSGTPSSTEWAWPMPGTELRPNLFVDVIGGLGRTSWRRRVYARTRPGRPAPGGTGGRAPRARVLEECGLLRCVCEGAPEVSLPASALGGPGRRRAGQSVPHGDAQAARGGQTGHEHVVALFVRFPQPRVEDSRGRRGFSRHVETLHVLGQCQRRGAQHAHAQSLCTQCLHPPHRLIAAPRAPRPPGARSATPANRTRAPWTTCAPAPCAPAPARCPLSPVLRA